MNPSNENSKKEILKLRIFGLVVFVVIISAAVITSKFENNNSSDFYYRAPLYSKLSKN